MNIFDKLTDSEKQAMRWYIDTYAGESNEEQASLEHVMRVWDGAKSIYLYKLLGNNLKISRDIEIEMDHDELCREIDKKMEDYNNAFYKFYLNVRTFDINYQRNHSYMYSIGGLFCSDYLVSNKYTGPNFELIKNDGKPIQIHNGCKTVKMLCDLAKAFDIEGAEEFRLEYSRVMNKKKYKGKLTLSIHPLDFMTMSDNESGWDSCMSWRDSGCYRQGTVEMMNSENVIVAYLESKKPMNIYGDFTWANKKWRELFIATPDNINAVKGYPYQSKQLASYVINWISELAKENLGWSFCDDVISYNYSGSGFKYNDREYEFTFETNNMYNDFDSLDVNYCKLSTAMANSEHVHNAIRYTYSGDSECMWCGDTNPTLDSEQDLICVDCYNRDYCSCCGEVIQGDVYELDGNNYCEDCYEEHAVECVDGDMHDYDNCSKIYLARAHLDDGEDVNIDDSTDQYVWVFEDRWWRDRGINRFFPNFKRDNNGSAYYHTVTQVGDWWRYSYNYVYPEECSSDALDAFGITKDELPDYIDSNC